METLSIALQGPIKVQELAKLDKIKSKRKKSLKVSIQLCSLYKLLVCLNESCDLVYAAHFIIIDEIDDIDDFLMF